MRKLKPSFDDYELEPSPDVWMKIESRLDTTPVHKRGWLYFGIAVVAVVSIVLFILFFYDVEIKVKPKHQETSQPIDNPVKQQERESKNGHYTTNGSVITSEKDLPGKNESVIEKKKITKPQKQRNDLQRSYLTTKTTSSKNESFFSSVVPGSGMSTTSENEQQNLLVSNEEKTVTQKTELIDPFNFQIEQEILIPETYKNQINQPVKTKVSLSRWQLMLGASAEYNYRVLNASGNNAISGDEKNYFENEKGIHSVSFSAFTAYSFSTHFNLISGVQYFSGGQERSQSKVIQSKVNPAGTSPNVYSITTSAGNVSGDSHQFNDVIFSGIDSSLFQPSAFSGPLPVYPASVTGEFRLRQQFYFISFPVLIQYQATEHFLTPYLGIGFSVNYLVKAKVMLNGNTLDYGYSGNLNKFLFSGEVQPGVKLKINNHYSVSLQSSLRYGLNSINSTGQVKWIPYAWGLGGGLNYRF